MIANEAHKKIVKAKYNKNFKSCTFSKGDLILVYEQEHHKLGFRKFEPMWHGP